MSLSLSRSIILRQALRRPSGPWSTTTTTGRAASSATNAANAAGEAAKTTGSKAAEGLTRVASSAGSLVSKYGAAAGRALGGIGGRTGRLIGAVQSLIPPTIYYSRVALELGKVVFETRKMSPPSMQVFQSYFNRFLTSLRNPSSFLGSSAQPSSVLTQLRHLSNQQLAAAGIVTAEAIGFFSIGEMIGRLKIVGYRSKTPAHE